MRPGQLLSLFWKCVAAHSATLKLSIYSALGEAFDVGGAFDLMLFLGMAIIRGYFGGGGRELCILLLSSASSRIVELVSSEPSKPFDSDANFPISLLSRDSRVDVNNEAEELLSVDGVLFFGTAGIAIILLFS